MLHAAGFGHRFGRVKMGRRFALTGHDHAAFMRCTRRVLRRASTPFARYGASYAHEPRELLARRRFEARNRARCKGFQSSVQTA